MSVATVSYPRKGSIGCVGGGRYGVEATGGLCCDCCVSLVSLGPGSRGSILRSFPDGLRWLLSHAHAVPDALQVPHCGRIPSHLYKIDSQDPTT